MASLNLPRSNGKNLSSLTQDHMMLLCCGMLDQANASIVKKLKMNLDHWSILSSMPEALKVAITSQLPSRRKSSSVFTISKRTKPSKRFSRTTDSSPFHTSLSPRWTWKEKPKLKDSLKQKINGWLVQMKFTMPRNKSNSSTTPLEQTLSKALPSPPFCWKTFYFSFSSDFSTRLLFCSTKSFSCKLFGSLSPFLLSLSALVGLSTLWLTILHFSNSRETNTEALLSPSTSWEAKEVNGEEKAILCLHSSPLLDYCGSSLAKLRLSNNSKNQTNLPREWSSTESLSTYG